MFPPAFQPMPNFAQYNSNEFLYHSPHPNQRRHSSYSTEDILHMKHQNPPIDPRYRDSRPFIKSSSNIYDHAKRDFMSRRRSSSSLQEDILRPFQQIQLNQYLGRSSPTINRTRSNSPNASSDKSNSNWNLNPAIFIEEYNDNQSEVKSNNSSTNLSLTNEPPYQPLNEESVAGCVDIPFIDDENDQLAFAASNCDSTTELVNAPRDPCPFAAVQRPTIQSAANTVTYMNKNRKTVSFDLMDSMEELNKIRRSNIVLNKSNTCDHITNVHLNKCKMANRERVDAITKEPIFKFCTLKHFPPTVAHSANEKTESFQKIPSVDNNSDCSCNNLSAYFDESVNEHRTDRRIGCRPTSTLIDAKAMTLDLSDLQSDSTNSSTDPRPIAIDAKPSKFAYIAAWKPPAFFDKMNFGHGKVQALKNYFEKMKFPADVVPISQSTPDLIQTTDDGKLSAAERQKVIEQLQEWSEFGTADKPKCVNARMAASKPMMRSVLNLTVTTSFNADPSRNNDTNIKWTESNRCQSAPDIREHKKFPDAYIVRRQKVCTNIKSTTHDLRKSCPELAAHACSAQPKPFIISSKLKTNIYSSPCHRSTHQTLRKIKQNQKASKMAKCCRHRVNAGAGHQQQSSAGDGNGTDIEPR